MQAKLPLSLIGKQSVMSLRALLIPLPELVQQQLLSTEAERFKHPILVQVQSLMGKNVAMMVRL